MVKPLKDILKELEKSKPLRFQYGGYGGFEGEGGYTGPDSPAEFGDQGGDEWSPGVGRDESGYLPTHQLYDDTPVDAGPTDEEILSSNEEIIRYPESTNLYARIDRPITDTIFKSESTGRKYGDPTIPLGQDDPVEEGLASIKEAAIRGAIADAMATTPMSWEDEVTRRGWGSALMNHLPGAIPGVSIQATYDPNRNIYTAGLGELIGDLAFGPASGLMLGQLDKQLGTQTTLNPYTPPERSKALEGQVAQLIDMDRVTPSPDRMVAAHRDYSQPHPQYVYASDPTQTQTQFAQRKEDDDMWAGRDDPYILPKPIGLTPANIKKIQDAGTATPSSNVFANLLKDTVYRDPRELGWWKAEEYPGAYAKQGGLASLAQGGDTARFARGGWGRAAKALIPLGIGAFGNMMFPGLGSALGGWGAEAAGAAAGYALGGKRRNFLDAIKGGLGAYAGAGIARLAGAGLSTSAPSTYPGYKGLPGTLPPGVSPKGTFPDFTDIAEMETAYQGATLPTSLEQMGRGLSNIATRGGIDAIKPALRAAAGPIAAGVAGASLTPPSEMAAYQPMEQPQTRQLTPEQRKQLAMKGLTGPQYSTFAGYTPPNVDIGFQPNYIAATGGSVNSFAEGEMVVAEEKNPYSFGDSILDMDQLNMIGDALKEAVEEDQPKEISVPYKQEFLLDILRKLEVAGKDKGVNWREDPDLISQANRHIRPYYDEDIVELEKTVTIKTAKGGLLEAGDDLTSGSFVLPADVVSDVGDGSSSSGHNRLSKMFNVNDYARGGLSGRIKGPGSGLDDLIQTSIDGVRSARLSNDEFVIPSKQVCEIGDGSCKEGSEKLYAFMKDVRLKKHGTSKQPKELRMAGLRNIV
jgi:hypothetical protein